MTSLIAKKDLILATQIEEAIRKNESLESLTVDNVRRDIARSRITEQKWINVKSVKISNEKNKITRKAKEASAPAKSSKRPVQVSRSVKSSSASTSRKAPLSGQKSVKSSGASTSRKAPSSGKKRTTASKRSSSENSAASKLSVVGFRGRSSWSNKKESLRSS